MLSKFISRVLIAVSIIGLWRCESEREFKNIFDPHNSNPSSWKPENVVIQQVTVDQLLITWENPNQLVQGYLIDRKIGEGNWEHDFQIIDDRDQKDCQDTVFSLGGIQTYRVCAVADKNRSDWVEVSVVTTIASPQFFTLRQVGEFAVQLQWRDMSNGEEGFVIARKAGNSEWLENYKTLPADTTTWIDSSVALNAVFQYRLEPYLNDFIGESAEATIETKFPAVQNFSAESLSDSSLLLSWSPHPYFDVTDYRLLRSVDAGNFSELAVVDTNIYIDATLEKGKTYRYQIEAVTSTSSSDQSVVKSVTWVGPIEQLWSQMNAGRGDIQALEIAGNNSFVAAAFRTGSSMGMPTAGALYLWGLTTGSELLKGYAKVPKGIAIAQDQSAVAVADEGYLTVWNVSSGTKQWELTGMNYLSVSLNPALDRLVAACGDNYVRLYNLSSGTLIWEKDLSSAVNYVKFSPTGDGILYNAANNGMLDLNGTITWSGNIAFWEFSSDGSKVIANGRFNADDSKVIGTGEVAMALSATGATLWSASAGGSVAVYDASSGAEIWSAVNETEPHWIGNGDRAVARRNETELIFHDGATGELLGSINLSGTLTTISLLDVSPNGERICIGAGAYVYTYGYANYWKVTTES